jgi:rhodanese-related sulfurtransferase
MPGCKGWFTKKAPEKKVEMRTLTAEEVQSKMEQTEKPMVINVLSEKSYEDCRIAGSTNTPVSKLADASKAWQKDQEIILYCSSYQCGASKNAYHILKNLGFTNLYAYEGGVKEWHEKKFPTGGACQADYLK